MSAIKWDEKYSVGNEFLDAQHQELIRLTNRLSEHATAETDSELISNALQTLHRFIYHHFKDEEQLMSQVGYPLLEEHKIEHNKLVEDYSELCFDVMDNKQDVSRELIDLLLGWWKEHILIQDMKYITGISE